MVEFWGDGKERILFALTASYRKDSMAFLFESPETTNMMSPALSPEEGAKRETRNAYLALRTLSVS